MFAGLVWDGTPDEWDDASGVWDIGTVDRTDSIRLRLAEARGIFSEIFLADALRVQLDELALGSSNILTGDALRLARAWDRRTLCINDWPRQDVGSGSWAVVPEVSGGWSVKAPVSASWSEAPALPRSSEGCSS